MNKGTVAFHTLGCKLNFSESSQLARQFEKEGYRTVRFDEKAEVYVINTCSVTENADRECRTVVQRALRRNPASFIAVTGCYAQLKPKEVGALEGVDLVAGASEKFNIVERIGDAVKKHQAEIFACDIATVIDFEPARSGTRTRTFLKVQDGCDYTCSFCTIPLARGRSRSDTVEKAVERARRAASEGAKEIVLTGVNLGDFRYIDKGHTYTFADLIAAMDARVDVPRIRISSIEPNLLSDEIIESVAASRRFMPHFHIPLQSGSDPILRSMRRRYRADLYRRRVEKIKATMPHACIGADVITGYPGETDAQFNETVCFLQGVDVSYLHVFTYSERDHTDASLMERPVPVPERKRRTRILRNLSDRKHLAFLERFKGQTANVLFENNARKGLMNGYTENYIKVRMPYDPSLVNTVQEFVLVEPDNEVMTGHLKDQVNQHA